ncbi:MAG: calcium/sodium antiporter [Rhodomicrobium sp.]|nr:calcium/sodium antiporter [Rhodomicrobium sp.]
MIYVELVAGLILLVVGGDLLVRGAVGTARHMGVSPLLIGLTLVGFGTSTPELVTSVEAALLNSPGIAVGNVVGSNIANILLILGLAAVLSPLGTPKNGFRRDSIMLIIATSACTAVVLAGYLDRMSGAILVAMLISYVIFTYFRERVSETQDSPQEKPMALRLSVVLALGGLVLVILGAGLLVDAAIGLAKAVGISETIIGLTIVAVGTSLPELITSIMAAIRKQTDVAYGNIVGSNIYNVLGILGVTALVQPIEVPAEIIRLDIWVMIAATMLMLLFAATSWRVNRLEGATFLAAYCAYIGYLAYTM